MIPQIAIQSYNNCLLSNWSSFNIFAVCISCFYIILTIIGYKFIIAKEEEYKNTKAISNSLAHDNNGNFEIAVEEEQNKVEAIQTIESLVCESY
jgi:hypothetical protein